MNIENTELDAFTDYDVQLLELLASHSALAVSRLRSPDQLKASEERFRGIAERSFDVIFTLDLDKRGIEPGIRIRRNSSRRARGCPARKRVVIEYLEDPEAWKRRVGYGRRGMAETAFSTYKRMFGGMCRPGSIPTWSGR